MPALLATQIHFIIPACENMVDGKGLRPGDVLVASNGKTVEINNTDAEGRLTLADAMLYAQKGIGVGEWCGGKRACMQGPAPPDDLMQAGIDWCAYLVASLQCKLCEWQFGLQVQPSHVHCRLPLAQCWCPCLWDACRCHC